MNESKRLVLFIALSAAVMLGWSKFFPAPHKPVSAPTEQSANAKPSELNGNKPSSSIVEQVNGQADIIKTLDYIELSNSAVKYKVYSDFSIEVFPLQSESETFAGTVGFERIPAPNKLLQAQFTKVNEKEAAFTLVDGKTGTVLLEESGLINFNFSDAVDFSFNVKTTAKELNGQKRKFIILKEKLVSTEVGSEFKDESSANWFGLDFNYNLLAVVFSEKVTYVTNLLEDGSLSFKTTKGVSKFSYLYSKKDYDFLKSVGHHLDLAVDFGILSFVAIPIMRTMQFFYKFIPNYGISIILLTIVIRLLTFPLQWKSFKSMKKMQDIQPEIAKIKERYKDDPQALQRETMQLFKKSGANPLGGCLPLILQMPIFFAMYQVLQNSVELVRAPFMMWISDLSIKDPFYIFPVILAIVMFLQQKLSPTTVTDPAQKKIMLFMPFIFAVVMKDMPSGLSLYIIISTLMGIGQQFIVYKFAK